MKPLVMASLLLVSLACFAWSIRRRWRLMRVAAAPAVRTDRLADRLAAVMQYVFAQKRMLRYPLAGVAHLVIFFGFLVLLINTLILWGRAFQPAFSLFIFGEDNPLGAAYAFLRDVFTVLVILGAAVFVYYRAVGRLKRLTLNAEGMVILAIILAMMLADLVYEGGLIRLAAAAGGGAWHARAPFASLAGLLLSPLPGGALRALVEIGYWAHSVLVLVFLNLLPYGKHFHVITVVPNVFLQNLGPRGRLAPIADMDGRIERGERLGVRTARDLSWKSVLDLYTCTECGRCSDHCPATRTGKLLSPKHLTIQLRDHFYRRERSLLAPPAAGSQGAPEPDPADDLTPEWIKPEALWACTTCAACEQECPVFISYIDKIVDMRRNLVLERGEFPQQLQTAFRGLETVGNPYSFDNGERAAWAAGLDVPLRADKPDAEYLFWVGCSPSFDDRARRIARATATLLKHAGVDFAILGPEEQCTGDPARRAGNEYLAQTLAAANVATLQRYGVRKIVTTCPHCFNTLRNEYPDFGGRFEVIHHSALLAELVRAGRLRPTHPVDSTVTYHDACYLGRHNGVYDAPRDILRAIPGLRAVEPEATRDRGMCCGAGGAQMWKEEEHGTSRVNHERARQLLRVLPGDGHAAGAPAGSAASGPGCARTIASACPFCMTMLTDGLRDQGHEDVATRDVAELLLASVAP